MKIQATRLLMAAGLVCLGAGLLSAQDEDDSIKWRRQVDRLIDRWSDDVEGDRLRLARSVLARRVRDADDPEARLELARVKLAIPQLRLRDRAKAARLLAEQYREARELVDRAAGQLAIRDSSGKLIEGGGQRYQTCLALALIATQRRFQEAMRAARMGGAKAESLKPLIVAQAEEVAQRRRQLQSLLGDKTGAVLQREVARLSTLQRLQALGRKPQPLGIKDLAGKSIDLSEYEGHVVLVLFWSTQFDTCEPVVKAVKALEAKFRDKKVVVLSVSLDQDRSALDALLAKGGLPWRHCHAPRGLTSDVARAWKIRALPDGVLIDHEGRVRYVRPWSEGLSWLEASVKELIARRDAAREE
ncbi:MAG: redoxin domain-containing protein [Planctomycetes bacterium]|nr:redoxin domain-containing protein [Planctomycetota bacterium]